jgi:kynurenine formamidase
LWGSDDQLGTVNLLGPEQVLDAVSLVHKGAVFPMNWELELPDPPLYGREPLQHHVVTLTRPVGYDDYYNGFYPQASSQWDALSHVGHPEFGFYNGRTATDFTGKPGTKNGIDNYARRGIVGRGVLLDAERYFERVGRDYDPGAPEAITAAELQAVADAEGLSFRAGDILVVRTGWVGWYLRQNTAKREDLAIDSVAKGSPGLASGRESARFLWDNHFAAIATDCPAFEVHPTEVAVGPYLHYDAIPLLGLAVGELWDLEALAQDCDQDRIYEFLLTSAPLNKLGGTGSPPNALAIK